jgi:hypothetical protein
VGCRGALPCAALWTGAILITALGAAAWLLALIRRRSPVAPAVVAMLGLPALLLVEGGHPYQYYKLLLAVSPLLAIGLWVLPGELPPAALERSRVGRAAMYGALTLLLVGSGVSTGRLAQASVNGGERSLVRVVNSPDQRARYARVERSSGRDMLAVSAHPIEIAWLAYHARRNRLWLINSTLADLDLRGTQGADPSIDPARIPSHVDIVRGWEYPTGQTAGRLAVFVDNPGGVHGSPGSERLPATEPMTLVVFSPTDAGRVALSFDVTPGAGGRRWTRVRVARLPDSGPAERLDGAPLDGCEAPVSGRTHVECVVEIGPGVSRLRLEGLGDPALSSRPEETRPEPGAIITAMTIGRPSR